MLEATHMLIVSEILDRYFNIKERDEIYTGLLAPDQIFTSKNLYHTKENTYEEAKNLFSVIKSENSHKNKHKIGELIHYLEDWFCSFHQESKFFQLLSHYKYEKNLHRCIKIIYSSEEFWEKIDSINEKSFQNFFKCVDKFYSIYVKKISEDQEKNMHHDIYFASIITLIALKDFFKEEHVNG